MRVPFSPSTLAVWQYLEAALAAAAGPFVQRSYQQIAQAVDCRRSTAFRACAQLERAGIVRKRVVGHPHRPRAVYWQGRAWSAAERQELERRHVWSNLEWKIYAHVSSHCNDDGLYRRGFAYLWHRHCARHRDVRKALYALAARGCLEVSQEWQGKRQWLIRVIG